MAASKVVIITGASRGIGLAITNELLANKHRVCLVSRSGDDEFKKLETTYPDQVRWVTGDLTEPTIASKVTSMTIMAYGQIDGLVVNHGALEPIAKLENCSLEEFKKLYDVNVFSAFNIAQTAIPELRKSKGSIVFTSSGAATKAYQGWGPYGSSKAALNSLASHLAEEESDITTVSIAPGRVDTEMQKTLREKGKGFMDDSAYQTFVDAFNSGDLFKPEQPGGVMARLVVGPDKGLSGKFLKWSDAELAAYQDKSS
ncbi:putative short-chain dehydrogenase [Zalerion maritima]|uniref:Short-chain dehydrogenase n=1 Tax=Zalerion maritima TaxID=339359 RepID=A0AAD5RRX3_9PEZI|nr:putative short-chain dehydrogenase [Zalerion maritima]